MIYSWMSALWIVRLRQQSYKNDQSSFNILRDISVQFALQLWSIFHDVGWNMTSIYNQFMRRETHLGF